MLRHRSAWRAGRTSAAGLPSTAAASEAAALPPLFQLSRIAMLFGFQMVLLWLYLRFGTESWRDVSALPFLVAACLLVSLGLGLNARYDPTSPAPPAKAWGRAIAVGVVSLGAVIGITADDVVAGLYGLAVGWIVTAF